MRLKKIYNVRITYALFVGKKWDQVQEQRSLIVLILSICIAFDRGWSGNRIVLFVDHPCLPREEIQVRQVEVRVKDQQEQGDNLRQMEISAVLEGEIEITMMESTEEVVLEMFLGSR